MSEIIETAEEAVEELFPPRRGGLVDRHRRRLEEEAVAADAAVNTAERIEQPSYKAVKTAQEMPEVFSVIITNIQPGATAMVLPASPYRYDAQLMLTTAGATVSIAKDSSAALGGIGFPLIPSVYMPPLHTRSQVWAYNSGGSVASVVALIENYSPET
jgi:hypothetical protein